ncbi:RNA recognition motif domain-containing protein [Hahella ganghwensis]|uniref:RNA recognition motif domain-containing protein n=1 Tax=Hahella ganghwensis TaxID=286420 RepID=UPI000475BC91|nr:RNA-binding protein [Hahella ganghwensis]
MNIYVGNLAYTIAENQLKDLFEAYGAVSNVTIIKDNFTAESKGFGFVEMERQIDAEAAIKKLDGLALQGRNLKVNQAKPRNR